jgi:hypothetical protein
MSLKAFHVVFVVVCTVFGLGFSLWSVRRFRLEKDPMMLVLAVLSFAGSVGLVIYGRWFLKKHKRISYL